MPVHITGCLLLDVGVLFLKDPDTGKIYILFYDTYFTTGFCLLSCKFPHPDKPPKRNTSVVNAPLFLMFSDSQAM